MIPNIAEQHIDSQLKNHYFKDYRWILHIVYWLHVYVFGQMHHNETLFSWEGFLLNFLYDNWIIIVFYYIFALLLVPKLFKKNKYYSFWFWLICMFIVLPLLNYLFAYSFESYLPERYQDASINNTFLVNCYNFYRVYLLNFILFAAFLFLVETTEGIRNYKAGVKADLETQKSQKKLLKTKIEPTFIMQTLDRIIDQAEQASNTTGATIVQFSDVLRYRLYKSQTDVIHLDAELEQVKNAFQLYNKLYDKQFVLEVVGETNKSSIYTSSILGGLLKILSTTQPSWNDQLIVYFLISHPTLDIAIEWDSPYPEKNNVIKEIAIQLHEFYDKDFQLEQEVQSKQCSIRVQLQLC